MIWDRPLELIGRGAQAVLNRLRRNHEPVTGLPARLLHERDIVVGVLGRQWWEALLLAAGRWVLDYLTLIAALYAVGATPRASLVLLAFCAAQLLGNVPLTPGGVGFVEAGLTGTLALAGVGGGAAVVATLAYRLVSFWLPIPAGAVAAVIHRRRYGIRGGRAAAAYAGNGSRPNSVLNSFVSCSRGNGLSGTSTPSASQIGSQPSTPSSQTTRRSSGT